MTTSKNQQDDRDWILRRPLQIEFREF